MNQHQDQLQVSYDRYFQWKANGSHDRNRNSTVMMNQTHDQFGPSNDKCPSIIPKGKNYIFSETTRRSSQNVFSQTHQNQSINNGNQ